MEVFFLNYTFKNGALNQELYHVDTLEPLDLCDLRFPALSLSAASGNLSQGCLGCLEGSDP